MAIHNDFGKKAEELAVTYLKENGYKILVTNFRFQKAEIDIIAEKNNIITIIEVKARSTDAFILPYEAINKKKIKLIVLAANNYLETMNLNKEVQFDIISILPDQNSNLIINHLKSAFDAFDANN